MGWSDTSNLAQLRIWWKTYEMRGRGIFISVELVLLRASSRKCSDSIIEREPSKRPAQPEDTLGGKRGPC